MLPSRGAEWFPAFEEDVTTFINLHFVLFQIFWKPFVCVFFCVRARTQLQVSFYLVEGRVRGRRSKVKVDADASTMSYERR